MDVSIIIPNYNNALFIEECLKCCVNQITDLNAEIIIVDDHSTDTSWDLLCKYQTNHSRVIRIFKNPKKGACSARNYGYNKSSGKYIQFLDSDDILSKDKLKKQLGALKNADKSFVANCGWIHFDDTPEIEKYKRQLVDKTYTTPINWLLDSWNGGGMGQTGCWLIPRELIEKAGGWDESLLKNQDGEFIARIICNAVEIEFCHEVFAFYRKPTKGNVSSNLTKDAVASALESYKSYEYILRVEDSKRIRTAIAKNYNSFIYSYYNRYPELVSKAKRHLSDLGENIDVPFSNRVIRNLALVLGIHNTMKLRNILRGY
ncbi:MAG: glycosyltransferase family 2 protein [Bacteroidetes bacterium]|nr:glycosyltransferase family 2 protein [Bacteroidota bacterium]